MEIDVITLGELLGDPHLGKKISPRQGLEEILAAAVMADEAGLDVFGVGEHQRLDFVVSAVPVVLAAIAQKTKRIRLTSAVTVQALRTPRVGDQNFATGLQRETSDSGPGPAGAENADHSTHRTGTDCLDRDDQEESRNGRRSSDQSRVERNKARLAVVLDSELRLRNGLRFPDLGSEVEYPAHSESGAEAHTCLKKSRCTGHGRKKKKQSPGGGNAEDHESRPQKDRHAQPDPAALHSPSDLGRPDIAGAGNIFLLCRHDLLSSTSQPLAVQGSPRFARQSTPARSSGFFRQMNQWAPLAALAHPPTAARIHVCA